MTVTEQDQARAIGRRSTSGVLVAVLALLLGLAGGFFVGRATSAPDEPAGLASESVAAFLVDRVAALNSGDAAALAAFYTQDAVLEERDQDPPVITEGAEAIADHLVGYQSMGFRVATESVAVQYGQYASEELSWSGGAGGSVAYRFDDTGKIAHQWVLGGWVEPALR